MVSSRAKVVLCCAAIPLLVVACGIGIVGPSDVDAGTDNPADFSVSPSASARGATLTIRGNGFANGTTVEVGGVSCASLTVVSAAEINCRLGAHRAGVSDVVVRRPGHAALNLTGAFRYRSFLYAATSSEVTAFEINENSTLSALGFPAETVTSPPTTLLVVPSGRFLVSYSIAGGFNVWPIDPLTGALQPDQFSGGLVDSVDIVASPTADLLFVSLNGATVGGVAALGIQADGSLSSLGNQGVNDNSAGMAFSSDGRSIYVGATIPGVSLNGYDLSGPTFSNQQAYSTALSGNQVAVSGDDGFVFYYDTAGFDLACHRRLPNGVLQPGITTSDIGNISVSVRVHPVRRSLYVVAPNGVTTFTWDDACLLSGVAGGSFNFSGEIVDVDFDVGGSFIYAIAGTGVGAQIKRGSVAADGIVTVISGGEVPLADARHLAID